MQLIVSYIIWNRGPWAQLVIFWHDFRTFWETIITLMTRPNKFSLRYTEKSKSGSLGELDSYQQESDNGQAYTEYV